MKGFNATVTARHLNLMPGESVYMKACAWKYSTPTMYAVLERKNGKKLMYVNGNEFRNRFNVV